jgi:hypothetical protein
MVTAFDEWVATTPPWLIGLVLIGVVIGMWLLGTALRRRRGARSNAVKKEGEDEELQEGYVVSGILGLGAFLVAITFSMAVDRFDSRRALVLEEANAIGTVYLRTQLLDEPYRTEISGMLVAYTDNRIELAQVDPGKESALLETNNRLVADLWRATIAVFPTIKSIDFSGAYLDSMNTVIELDSSRKQSRMTHVPGEVFLLLFICSAVSAGILGYLEVAHFGRVVSWFMFVLLVLAIVVVLDIDQPVSGGVSESQAAMLRLRESLKVDYTLPRTQLN